MTMKCFRLELFYAVNSADIGMIERRRRSGLALEALEQGVIAGHGWLSEI
jgi:hypothetical protein